MTSRDTLLAAGAVFEGAQPAPVHFGDPAAELSSLFTASALAERSDLGRIMGRGAQVLDLLNRLSTAQLSQLLPGEGKPTVLTTAKGRIVERLFVHHLGEQGVALIGGRGSAARTLDHLRRHTFREDAAFEDVTAVTCQLTLSGPRAAEALESAGFARPLPHHGASATIHDHTCHVLGEDGLSPEGFSVVAAPEQFDVLWRTLAHAVSTAAGRPAGALALESYRVLRGIPGGGTELNAEHNPLEAGLWDAVSFDKGCYVGQEVVARLRTYDKVSRLLVGLALPEGSAVPPPGTPIVLDGREVGRLTSAVLPPGRTAPVALAYVKRRDVAFGAEVQLGAPAAAARARVVELPFPP